MHRRRVGINRSVIGFIGKGIGINPGSFFWQRDVDAIVVKSGGEPVDLRTCRNRAVTVDVRGAIAELVINRPCFGPLSVTGLEDINLVSVTRTTGNDFCGTVAIHVGDDRYSVLPHISRFYRVQVGAGLSIKDENCSRFNSYGVKRPARPEMNEFRFAITIEIEDRGTAIRKTHGERHRDQPGRRSVTSGHPNICSSRDQNLSLAVTIGIPDRVKVMKKK